MLFHEVAKAIWRGDSHLPWLTLCCSRRTACSGAVHPRSPTHDPIGPVPFVGRQAELTELKEHLAIVSLVSLHGALGPARPGSSTSSRRGSVRRAR